MESRRYPKSSVIQYISSRTAGGKIKDFRRVAPTFIFLHTLCLHDMFFKRSPRGLLRHESYIVTPTVMTEFFVTFLTSPTYYNNITLQQAKGSRYTIRSSHLNDKRKAAYELTWERYGKRNFGQPRKICQDSRSSGEIIIRELQNMMKCWQVHLAPAGSLNLKASRHFSPLCKTETNFFIHSSLENQVAFLTTRTYEI
jgi:hypothetical protein